LIATVASYPILHPITRLIVGGAQENTMYTAALLDPARFDAPVLGNVGRFSPQKNPLDWVRVAGRVARSLPDCHFLLVGDGPLRPEVESAVQAAGLSDRTVLTGLRSSVCVRAPEWPAGY
jgi:glycosyltransferase involved in cell wall biosynthesis